MDPSTLASELIVIHWPEAGYPKMPPAVRRRVQTVIARVAWNRAIEKAESEISETTYDRPTIVARSAWRATIPIFGPAYSISVLAWPHRFDQMTRFLKRMAMKAIERRVKENNQSHTSDETVYEIWMEWAKLSDSLYFTRQTEVDLLTRRR